jgi:hypothetical protein
MNEDRKIALFYAHSKLGESARDFASGLHAQGWRLAVFGDVAKEALKGLSIFLEIENSASAEVVADLYCLGLDRAEDGAISNQQKLSLDKVIEKIDLGLTMILPVVLAQRIVVVDQDDYERVLSWLKTDRPDTDKFMAGLIAKALEKLGLSLIAPRINFRVLSRPLG